MVLKSLRVAVAVSNDTNPSRFWTLLRSYCFSFHTHALSCFIQDIFAYISSFRGPLRPLRTISAFLIPRSNLMLYGRVYSLSA